MTSVLQSYVAGRWVGQQAGQLLASAINGQPVASTHAESLDFDEALRHARGLLAPGGRLLVVGLARVTSARDLAVDVASAFLNPLLGLVKHPRRARPGDAGPDAPGMPVQDPGHSVDEVARAARVLLPGARVRRRLFFRYTLEWTAPR